MFSIVRIQVQSIFFKDYA